MTRAHVESNPHHLGVAPTTPTGQMPRLLGVLADDPAAVALVLPDDVVRARDLRQSVLRLVSALVDVGVRPGDTVSVMTAAGSPTILAVRYAANLLGAAVSQLRSVNARSDQESLALDVQRHLVCASAPVLLVADRAHRDRATAIVAGSDIDVLVAEEADSCAAYDGPLPGVDPDGCAVLDLTSGTTARPKLVRHTFRARGLAVARAVGDSPREYRPVLLSCTPIYQSTSSMVDAALLAGGSVVLEPVQRASEVLTAIERHRVTDVYLPVPLLYALIDHPGTRQADLSSLRRVIYTGVSASTVRIAQAFELFGDTLVQLYGSTEAGGISVLTPQDHDEPELIGSVGRPFSWVEVQVRDPETGAVLSDGQPGELFVRSDTVMDGYVGQDAASDDTCDVLVNGWLRTGDLGLVDCYGFLRLHGRAGNVVKVNGLKVYPVEVERVLLEHPTVQNVAVYGVCDPRLGESLHAAVQPAAAELVGSQLKALVESRLSLAHVPGSFHWMDELPLSAAGKPDLTRLRESC